MSIILFYFYILMLQKMPLSLQRAVACAKAVLWESNAELLLQFYVEIQHSISSVLDMKQLKPVLKVEHNLHSNKY